MKSDPGSDQVAALLRTAKPAVCVPAGLDGRIRAAVAMRGTNARRRAIWPWWAVPAALAACFALVLSRLSSPSRQLVSAQDGPGASERPLVNLPVDGHPVAFLTDPAAPLQAESSALVRDARRAGGFILDCLPAIEPAH